MLEKALLVIFGGIVGSYLTLRIEVLKAWRSYRVVRLEIERNLRILENVQRMGTPTYSFDPNDQQRQIDQMIDSSKDCLPVRVSLLIRQRMPNWAYQAWESQLHLLAQILTEGEVRGVFEIQVNLERLLSIHDQLSTLVAKHEDTTRDRARELLAEWDSTSKTVLRGGNPLHPVATHVRVASILGLRCLFARSNSGEE